MFECGICLSESITSQGMSRTICGHYFHPECIEPWVNLGKNCPMCRDRVHPLNIDGDYQQVANPRVVAAAEKAVETHKVALRTAGASGNLVSVKRLLANGPDDYCGIAMENAAKHGHTEAVKSLAPKGLRFKGYVESAVADAAKIGSLDTVKFLLQEQPSEDSYGWALVGAAEGNQIDVLNFLFTQGPTQTVDFYNMALESAAEEGHLEVVKALLKKGVISEQGFGLAEWAAKNRGHVEIEKILKSKLFFRRWNLPATVGVALLAVAYTYTRFYRSY